MIDFRALLWSVGLALLLGSAPAGALTLTVEVDGVGTQSFSHSDPALGCAANGSTIGCSGSNLAGGSIWTLDSWMISADGDPFVDANLSLTNNSAQTQTFVMTVSEVAAIAAPATSGASVAGSLTVDNDGGTLGHNGSTSLFTALVDGAAFKTLLDVDSSATVGFGSAALGPDSFGLPGLTEPVPGGVASSIGVRLEFTLTPGDQASFTSRFEVIPVPEPGALGLLGIGFAGLIAFRRQLG